MSLKVALKPESYLSRMSLLGSIRADVDTLEASLSPDLKANNHTPTLGQLPTGIRSLDLAQCSGVLLTDQAHYRSLSLVSKPFCIAWS